MVGMHRLDYQNDADLVVRVDRLYIEHGQFPFSNFALVDDDTMI